MSPTVHTWLTPISKRPGLGRWAAPRGRVERNVVGPGTRWTLPAAKMGMTFDLEGTFSDDYPYFYVESIDDDHSDADTAEILACSTFLRAPGSSMPPAVTAA